MDGWYLVRRMNGETCIPHKGGGWSSNLADALEPFPTKEAAEVCRRGLVNPRKATIVHAEHLERMLLEQEIARG